MRKYIRFKEEMITLYDMHVVKEAQGMYGFFETKSFFTIAGSFLEDLITGEDVSFELLDNDGSVLTRFNVFIKAVVNRYVHHHDRYYFVESEHKSLDIDDYIVNMETLYGFKSSDGNNKQFN